MSADDWDLDEDDAAAEPGLLTPVPGVYNYCDAWCERCVFQLRCAVFRDRVLLEAELRAGQDGPPDDRAEPVKPVKGSDAAVSTTGQATLTSDLLDEADVNVDHDLAIWERRRRAREADPLYLQATQYSDLAAAMMATLRPEIEAIGDPVLLVGLDVIHWHLYAITVKVRRALGGLLDPWLEPDEDEDPVQTDYNGTAKLVRLMIAESRGAWETLLQSAGGVHSGRITGMLDRLAALDAGMAARFPRAMEFKRPGFDE